MTDSFDKIYSLISSIDKDWQPELEKMGLWSHFFNLYAEAKTLREGNILVAFIALAYNYRSDMIEFSKDRLETKRRIMIRIAGPLAMDDKFLHDAAYGLVPAVNRVANWYVESQKDWRWSDIISKIEFHSRINATASENLIPDIELGKTLKEATVARKEAQIMWDELRREYLPLDNALAAEGQPKLTDRMSSDFTNWESYIRSIKAEQKRKQDEEDEIKERAKELIKQQKEAEKLAAKST